MAFQTISKIFYQYDSDLTASEAHGLATGMLCIESNVETANWLAELFPQDIVLFNDDKTILVELFEQTRQLLEGEDDMFRYDLFLPGDDEPLKYQIEAVRSWCEGFLFGVGYNRSTSEWSCKSGEIMKDIVEFTKLDTHVEEDLDEDESNEQEAELIEIQEYLRAAVMTVRNQFVEESNGE